MNAKALICPASTDDVSAVMRLCNAAGQSVVVHGGLTGAVQGTVTTPDDIILSLERMNRIETLDPVSGTMTVQAGVTLQTVQETAEASDFIFPLDIGSRGSCTIGGNIATNAGGVQVIRYGMMRALVLGLEVVLADGRIVSSLDTVTKNNSGYDLKHLFIGSEGTLGVVTRAVLRLAPRPGEKRTAFVATESFDQLLDLLQHIRRCLGARLGSFEVMWHNYYEFAASAHDFPPPLPGGYDAYTIIEGLCDHDSDSVVFDKALEEAFESGLVVDGVVAQSGRERESFWNLRDSFMHIIAMYPDIVDLDTSVPILKTRDYMESTELQLRERFPELVLLLHGHLGDGNLHPLICGAHITPEIREEVERIFYEPLRNLGGAVSAEHGIGIERRRYLHFSRSSPEIDVMRSLKATLDPKNILNPGKVLP
jgi:FAD/FMN-containing dehydrogenase